MVARDTISLSTRSNASLVVKTLIVKVFGDFPSNDGAGGWGSFTGKEKASALGERQPVAVESGALHSWRRAAKGVASSDTGQPGGAV